MKGQPGDWGESRCTLLCLLIKQRNNVVDKFGAIERNMQTISTQTQMK